MYRRVHSARTKSRENTLKRERSDNEPRGSHLVLARGKKVDISSVIQVGWGGEVHIKLLQEMQNIKKVK